jgi:hypothetical protein
MQMWGAYWGPPWGGLGWIFPLIGLLFMVGMAFLCIRMMGGLSGFGCMGGHSSHSVGEVEDSRREVRELREEIRKLRERG